MTAYLDAFASTPLDPRVVQAMTRALQTSYANPSNIYNDLGRAAREEIEEARRCVCEILGLEDGWVVFNSGCSEGNNAILFNHILSARARGIEPYIVVSAIEHKSMLAALERFQRLGLCRYELVAPEPNGVVDPNRFAACIEAGATFASLMFVNNELGTIQPIRQVADHCASRGVPVHSDITQAIGKIPFSDDTWAARLDFTTFSAHKFYGPKGAGVLAVRDAGSVVEPLIAGGGQQMGARAGTESVAAIVGTRVALELMASEGGVVRHRLEVLTVLLRSELAVALGDVLWNNESADSAPGCVNISIPGLDASVLLEVLTDVALSTGSACSLSATQGSHVLVALGLSRPRIDASLRLSIHRFTSEDEIKAGVERLAAAVAAMRLHV